MEKDWKELAKLAIRDLSKDSCPNTKHFVGYVGCSLCKQSFIEKYDCWMRYFEEDIEQEFE